MGRGNLYLYYNKKEENSTIRIRKFEERGKNLVREKNRKPIASIGIFPQFTIMNIVVLIILASISVYALIGQNGIIERVKQAKEQTIIYQYKEKIEIIKTETRLKYNNVDITLEKLKNEFDSDRQKYWIGAVEIVADNGMEKIRINTKDGYVFYITEDTTEYRGKGQVSEIILAEDVSYTPQDIDWKVDDVKQALDYLFSN
ncbi:MAG: hypothetical protein V8R81_02050 [Clostridia bacterium]